MNEATLGFVLLGVAIGVLLALSFVSSLIMRFGSHRVTSFATLGMALALSLLPWMPHPLLLFVALILFGIVTSCMDVAMNAQAAYLEQQQAKPMMCHTRRRHWDLRHIRR